MTEIQVLETGHSARPTAMLALGVSFVGAVIFTVFTIITTQDRAVRAGSPWQNDPYDGVVSFTELIVPAVAIVMAARTLLWRRREPQPVFRVDQLLRAANVNAVLIGMTAVTDWLAVAVGADRPLWNGGTPWLIASLVPLTLVVVASLLTVRQAFRRLPHPRPRPPQGDWLHDLKALVVMVAGPLPGPMRRLATRFADSGAIEFLRRHILAFALGLSLLASLGTTTMEALGEGWSSPLLFITSTAIGVGGFFAFCLVANTVLHIAVPREAVRKKRHQLAGTTRRAIRAATLGGSLALPVSAVLRDNIWAALGHDEQVTSVVLFAGIVGVSTVLTAAVVFVGYVAVRRSNARPTRP